MSTEEVPAQSFSPAKIDPLGSTLLLVVSCSKARELLAAKLSRWGFSVSAFATSVEALAMQSQLPQRFRVLRADINGHPGDAELVRAFHSPSILLRHGGEQERLLFAIEKTQRIVVFKPIRDVDLQIALAKALGGDGRDAPTATSVRTNSHLLLLEEKRCPDTTPAAFSKAALLRILLVEDNVTNQLITTKLLARLGYTNLVTASNGVEAVEQYRSGHFDLILMDIMMPHMGGVEATEAIRSLRPAYIVAVTANTSNEDHSKYLRAGMDRVITKPVRVKDLEEIIGTVTAPVAPSRSTFAPPTIHG